MTECVSHQNLNNQERNKELKPLCEKECNRAFAQVTVPNTILWVLLHPNWVFNPEVSIAMNSSGKSFLILRSRSHLRSQKHK